MNVKQARAEVEALAQRCEDLMHEVDEVAGHWLPGHEQACAESIWDDLCYAREILLDAALTIQSLEDTSNVHALKVAR